MQPPQYPPQQPYPSQPYYPYSPQMPLDPIPAVEVTHKQEAEETSTLSEEETLQSFVRVRVIDLNTLRWPLRAVVFGVFAQLLVAAVVLALRGFPQPGVVVTLTGYGSVLMPATIVIVSCSGVILAWCVLLIGALQSRWFLRFPLLLLFTVVAFSMQGFLDPVNNALAYIELFAGLPLLLALWVWAICLPVIRRLALRFGIAEHRSKSFISLVTVGSVLIVMVTNYVVPFWIAGASGGIQQVGNGIGVATFFAFYLLLPALFLNGTDFAEWAETMAIAGTAVVHRSRSPRFMAAVTAVVAFGIATYAIVQMHLSHPHPPLWALIGVPLLFAPVCALLATAALALIFWVGGMTQWPRTRVPILGILAAVVVFTIAGLLLPLTLLLVPVVGLLLLWRGRGRGGRLAVLGVFLLIALPVGLASSGSYVLNVSAVQLLVAFATLWVMLWLIIRRKLGSDYREFIALLLWLNIALASVAAILDLLKGTGALGEQISVVAAVLLVLAQLWDLLMSGEQVTNVNGRLVPRHVRVLLYLGYVTLVTTLILYLSYWSKFVFDPVFGSFFDTDSWAALGLVVLGIPWIGATFATRLSEWIGRRRLVTMASVSSTSAAISDHSSGSRAPEPVDVDEDAG